MAIQFTYSISNNTKHGVVDKPSLLFEIENDVRITTKVNHIFTDGDLLRVIMQASLIAQEERALDAVVANHSGAPMEIITSDLPKSKLEGNPLAVHASYKPIITESMTYAVWSGAGDDLTDDVNGCGNGPLLSLESQLGTLHSYIDIEFNRLYGRIWLHEAYLKFTNAGQGDYVEATVHAYPVPLQQSVSLDLVVTDNWISYAPGGPGTGTHGFADPTAITLVDREFNADGDWNYDETNGLTPVFDGTGRYKMSDIEQTVHKFVNKVPCFGDCATYFSMSSDETTELQPGYFARFSMYNVSNTSWHASVIMELYRQKTFSP